VHCFMCIRFKTALVVAVITMTTCGMNVAKVMLDICQDCRVAARFRRDVMRYDLTLDAFHLQARRGMSQLEIEDEVATDLQRATGTADAGAGDSTRLNRVLQLTGAAGDCMLSSKFRVRAVSDAGTL